MTVEDVRSLLNNTGPLYTRDPEDVGHISDRWRKTILSLCDMLAAAPLDVAAQLREAQQQIANLATEINRLEDAASYLCEDLANARSEANDAEEAARKPRQLVEEAVPRMRSLNNQMSPGWLARAGEYLGSN